MCLKYDYYKSDTIFSSRMGSDPLCNVLCKKNRACAPEISNFRGETAHRHGQTDRRGTGKRMKDGKEQKEKSFEG